VNHDKDRKVTHSISIYMFKSPLVYAIYLFAFAFYVTNYAQRQLHSKVVRDGWVALLCFQDLTWSFML